MSIIDILPYLSLALGLAYDIGTAGYALLSKRDPRSQLGWLLICLFIPIIGATFFWLIGNNRIRTRARRWQVAGRFEHGPDDAASMDSAATSLSVTHPEEASTVRGLLEISARVTGRPLLPGNSVEPLFDGEQAYPAMLAAIDSAKEYVFLCSYIFDLRGVGQQFVDALGRASERGVVVWVLIDALGERYSRPRVSKALRKYPKVRVEHFLPLALSVRSLGINLRNHRKVLVVDGDIGFTGGMNIGQRHLTKAPGNKNITQDVHFSVRGPAVFALEQVFLDDWWFTRDAYVEPPNRANLSQHAGSMICRGIKDGPNEDFETIQWILVGALSCARHKIRVMTPYFVPGRELLAALTAAALRGVTVEIILPGKNNQPMVAWAAQSMLPEVVQYGTAVYYQPAPFNHSKFLVVDDLYVNLGSANLDPRSLRLNFEFNLEVFGEELAKQLAEYFDSVKARSLRMTNERLAGLGFFVRLRDAFAKLFAPYL